jgi:hypothetical protein
MVSQTFFGGIEQKFLTFVWQIWSFLMAASSQCG